MFHFLILGPQTIIGEFGNQETPICSTCTWTKAAKFLGLQGIHFL